MTDDALRYSLDDALRRYNARTGLSFEGAKAALFDMDGIIFDSMPGHARAWMQMCREEGIPADEDEFFMYEGRTGASTINILYRRHYGREATPEEIERLYHRKTVLFKAMPEVNLIPGAREALKACADAGITPVLVTGSGQGSLLERLSVEFPDAFPPGRRITGRDVARGKPHPEPYLKGIAAAGDDIRPSACIAIDNAPLGVKSAAASEAFTIGVRTGPIPRGMLTEYGADIEIDSMLQCTKIISWLL